MDDILSSTLAKARDGTGSPPALKAKIENMRSLIHAKADHKAQRATTSYEKYFNCRVRNIPQFENCDCVNAENGPIIWTLTSLEDPSEKLSSTKFMSFSGQKFALSCFGRRVRRAFEYTISRSTHHCETG